MATPKITHSPEVRKLLPAAHAARHTYEIGLDWKTGDYYAVIDGKRARWIFRTETAALAYIDAISEEWA